MQMNKCNDFLKYITLYLVMLNALIHVSLFSKGRKLHSKDEGTTNKGEQYVSDQLIKKAHEKKNTIA